MTRKIYKLSPIAPEWDPNWDLAPEQGVVVVRAESPADARVVASEAEPDFLEADAHPGEDDSTREASAFRNEKLYSVTEIPDGSFPQSGPRELLAGTISNPLKTTKIPRG
ncbi:hypothetical protein [Roseibium aggregatum]|uniref:Uncharacterized protein n=1 Tax=Roseibium aggregatum TaxID=187304 RepID=A0A926P5Z0_9HYPH|nr:hypothetical protein [Roseibium aggregatum]MBD1548771.1 hypothetical protein [Roseibium aggregatum]